MKRIYRLAMVYITALVGAVIFGNSLLESASGGNFAESVSSPVAAVSALSIAPVAGDAEAYVPVPQPIPETPTLDRQENQTQNSGQTLNAGQSQNQTQNSDANSSNAQSGNNQPGRPVRITIPNAGVNAKVMDVGVTPEGNLDVPPNFTDVGWYKYGTLPGAMGSAVLDGHVDNGGSIDGVFKRLRVLKPGDDIYIDTEAGGKLHFKVTRSDIYHKDAFPGESVFHEGGAKMIKLITCHGTYLPAEDTYDLRLVVTAELVE